MSRQTLQLKIQDSISQLKKYDSINWLEATIAAGVLLLFVVGCFHWLSGSSKQSQFVTCVISNKISLCRLCFQVAVDWLRKLVWVVGPLSCLLRLMLPVHASEKAVSLPISQVLQPQINPIADSLRRQFAKQCPWRTSRPLFKPKNKTKTHQP